MRIGPAANVARLNVAEDITALWTFANALGLLTDDINERTVAAGVTIDGVRLKDIAVDILGKASPANRTLGSDVVGDAEERFRLHAGGTMQWGDGANPRDTTLFRAAANRLKTDDSLEVAGVLGLIADIITERTGGAGVTVDGVRLLNGAVNVVDLASSTNAFLAVQLAAEAQARFLMRGAGDMAWGDGAAARDTFLQRDAAGELGTPDDFNVGGALDLAGDIELEQQTTVLGAGANNNIATGIVTVQRLDADTNGANLITGFAGGRDHRIILVMNIGTTDSPTLSHEDAGSVAANRLLLPLEANRTLSTSGGAWFIYDGAVSRWRMVRTI